MRDPGIRAFGSKDHGGQRRRRFGFRSLHRGGSAVPIRIDELGLDRPAVAADEHELVALGEALLHNRLCQRRDHVLLDGPLQGAGTHFRREPLLEQEILRRGLPFHRPLAVLEAAALQDTRQLLLEDAAHEVARQRMEHDHLVEPVLELGPEGLPNGAHHVVAGIVAGGGGKAHSRAAVAGRPQVGGEDDEAMAEVGDVAERVGEPSVVEHLQEQVPDVGVGLLELIEEHHRERLLAHPGDERIALRHLSAAQDLERGLGRLQLAHVESDQPVGGAEQEFRRGLGKLGLAGSRGAREQEHAARGHARERAACRARSAALASRIGPKGERGWRTGICGCRRR